MSFFFFFTYMCFCFFFHLYIEKAGPELVIINCFENLAKAVLSSQKHILTGIDFSYDFMELGSLSGSQV